MPAVKPKTTKPTQTEETIYPEVSVQICKGDSAITVQQAKDLLGWEEETQAIKFGEDYLFVDENKRKIRCFNNTKNRPLNEEWCRTLAQDILNRKWKFNCETIIIGNRGQIISGQHRLIALVLANQLWLKSDNDHHWRQTWDVEPSFESLVAFGAEESEEFTQTIDNVRTRTLADTLYTSDLFKTWKPRDKKVVVRVADQSVRLAWDRTGMANSRYASRITNTEACEFLHRHLRLLDAVKHVYTEDIKGSIQKCLTLGNAAAMMFLMAASEDDREAYESNTPPDESTLELKRWDDAKRYWIGFSIGRAFEELKRMLLMTNDEGDRISIDERLALVTYSWEMFLTKKPFGMDALSSSMQYEGESVSRKLTEIPSLGGIDVPVPTDDPEEREKA